LDGQKILVTGPTGQVAEPISRALARNNEVWGIARFSDGAARARLEAEGIRCVPLDLAAGDFSALPRDFDAVLNFAVLRTGDFDHDLAANVEATGLLMSHCQNARAFLHCSSTAVYQPAGHQPLRETDPLGDNHRVMFPTYSITKIAAEAIVRYGARQWNLPTTIARLNVPYGDNGGWPAFHLEMLLAGQPIPVHTDAPSLYNPIHEDDLIAQIPKLLEIASVPATIVNWAGRDQVSIEEWSAYLAEITGLEAQFAPSDQTLESVAIDTTRMHELVGETAVDWRDGFRRMVEARHPERLR
jgi:UDP-glucuronate 4-epimerase